MTERQPGDRDTVIQVFQEIGQDYAAAFDQLIAKPAAPSTAVGFPKQAAVTAKAIPEDAWKIDHPRFLSETLQALLSNPVMRDVYGSAGYDGYPTSYTLPATITDEQRSAAASALPAMRRACAPMDKVSLAYELGKLRATCAGRKGQGRDDEMAIDALVDDLSQYPADVVLDVLRYWRRAEQWWPTLAELLLIIEPRCTRRRAVVAALETAVADGGDGV